MHGVDGQTISRLYLLWGDFVTLLGSVTGESVFCLSVPWPGAEVIGTLEMWETMNEA